MIQTFFYRMSRDIEKTRKDNFGSKLRMDSNVSTFSKYYEENLNKHKELNNVVRKAREFQSNYWNQKILEVEEKNPHRWRHSGYKEMYVRGLSSESNKGNLKNSSRCRSPKVRDLRVRSPRPQSPRSSKSSNQRATSPKSYSSRTRTSRSPRRRSPSNTTYFNSKTRSPFIRRSNSCKSRSPTVKKFPNSRSKVAKNQCNQGTERRSPSSNSTCSDQSCSVCSPKSFEFRRKKFDTSKSRSRSQSNSTSSTKPRIYHSETIPSSSKLNSHRQEKYSSSPLLRRSSPSDQTFQSSNYESEQSKSSKKLNPLKQKENRLDSLKDSQTKAHKMVSKIKTNK